MFLRIYYLLPLLLLNSSIFAHGLSEEDKQRMIDGGYLQYLGLGATHMITGYDHLLFLFGVVFFLTNIRDITKFVSVFTIGHSITLIFSTFFKISANYYFIDAIIALSVIYKGFDNNGGFEKYFKRKSPNLLMAVFSFGLIHGFGLSTRLQQLPLGDDAGHIFLRIISFNVGVELGQIIALFAMVTILAGWRKTASFSRFSILANNLLMLAGLGLFYMQTHGLMHDLMVDDLKFNAKEHLHLHEDMDIINEIKERKSSHDSL